MLQCLIIHFQCILQKKIDLQEVGNKNPGLSETLALAGVLHGFHPILENVLTSSFILRAPDFTNDTPFLLLAVNHYFHK